MAWITPKTNWQGGQDGDKPTAADFNRIEGNIAVVREQSQLPLKYEVVSSFPAHAVGRVVFHTGNGRAYVSDGTNWIDISGRIGDALAAHVLEGKIFSSEAAGSGVTGTMPNRGAVVITPGTAQQAIQAGYHNGAGYVEGDADLVAEKIKKGVDIFGVTGNYPVSTVTPAADRLFHCDDKNYELNLDTLSAIKVADCPSTTPRGIGGASNRLFHCNQNPARNYELNPNSLAVINTATGPATNARGIGGTSSQLFHCDVTSPSRSYELNLDTLAVIKTVNTPNAGGIGGTDSQLFYCDAGSVDDNCELNPSTLAVIKRVNSPSSDPSGIGGVSNRLFHCDATADRNYELNPSTLATINTVNSLNTTPSGIGGMADNTGILNIDSEIDGMPNPFKIVYLGVEYLK